MHTIKMILYCYIEYIVLQQNLFALLQLLYTSTITTIIHIMLAKKKNCIVAEREKYWGWKEDENKLREEKDGEENTY